MAKITFMGAGSTIFARNVLGDCMCVGFWGAAPSPDEGLRRQTFLKKSF